LKASIPSRERKWDGDTKSWLLRADVAEIACALLRDFGLGYDFDEPITAGHRMLPEQAYGVLHLLPTAPRCVISAAYKALARQHHPDTGGDTEQMQRINAAATALRVAMSNARLAARIGIL